MKYGYGIVIFPRSWAWGRWEKANKFLFAIGPFRLVKYYAFGEWKE